MSKKPVPKNIQKGRKTRKRRKSQLCRAFEIKISHRISKEAKEKLDRLFLEAKWLYNAILAADPFSFDTKIKVVQIKNKDGELEDRELTIISGQMKQSMRQRICDSIKALAAAKKKGLKIGKIKFKKEISSIDLIQYRRVYDIRGHKLKIARIGILKCHGLEQIPKNCEIANAILLRRNGEYFVKINCFFEKTKQTKPEHAVGIDLGIKDSVVTSDGEKFKISVGESDHLKRASRRFNKKQKGSNNRNKARRKLKKHYAKMVCQKKDVANKIVNYLVNKYQDVVIQNENIVGWQKGLYGKQVQCSCLGTIKSKLIAKDAIVIDRFLPTTKMCYVCGTVNQLALSDRVYECQCGLKEDRDVKAAKTILLYGLKQIPVDDREYKPVEIETATHLLSGDEQVSVVESGSPIL